MSLNSDELFFPKLENGGGFGNFSSHYRVSLFGIGSKATGGDHLFLLSNAFKEILEENKHDIEEDELRKSVLMSIIISTEIRWKKNIEVIQIIQHSEYRQKGLPNNLNEVEPLGKRKSNR